MARNRRRIMGRRESGNFVQLPHCVIDADNWTRCGGSATRLLLELARQYNGHNNGDLCASISVLKPRGWRSADVLRHALAELRHYGFIELTRQGGLHRPSLYVSSDTHLRALRRHPDSRTLGCGFEVSGVVFRGWFRGL